MMSGSAGENWARLGGSLLYWACWTSTTTTMLLHSVLQWLTLVYSRTSTNGHFSTAAIFLANIPYIHHCFNLSTTATSQQWPLSSVPKVAVVVERFNCSVLTGSISMYFPLKVNGTFCRSVSYLNQMPSSTVECSQKVTSCSPGRYKQSPWDVIFAF